MRHQLTKGCKLIMALLGACLLNFSIQSIALANEQETAPLKIPTTIPEVWQAIDEHSAAISKLITANQLTTIHSHALAIRDLVRALPGLSGNLSPEKLAAVKRDSGYVDQLAVRLDKTGDANDKDGTIANFDKLQKILEQIKTNYTMVATPAPNE